MKRTCAFLCALLSAAVSDALAQTQYGTVSLNNYDSGKGLFEPGGSVALPGTIVEVLGGPDAASLTPIVSMSPGNPAEYAIKAGDLNANGPGTGSFFDYGWGAVNGVAPQTTGMFRIRYWRGAATFDQALTTTGAVFNSITWMQTTGTNPDPPQLPAPAVLQLPSQFIFDWVPGIVVIPRSHVATAGATVTFRANVTGAPPFRYQWRKDLMELSRATNATLTLTNISRADAGSYAVWVSDTRGAYVSDEATLRVLVPQRFKAPVLLQDGRVQLLFRDQEGTVALLHYAANFEVQVSTNLVGWQTANGSLALTNGFLVFEESSALNSRERLYRIIER